MFLCKEQDKFVYYTRSLLYYTTILSVPLVAFVKEIGITVEKSCHFNPARACTVDDRHDKYPCCKLYDAKASVTLSNVTCFFYCSVKKQF